jgi:hypothetical protein
MARYFTDEKVAGSTAKGGGASAQATPTKSIGSGKVKGEF